MENREKLMRDIAEGKITFDEMKKVMSEAKAIRELMNKYNEYRKKWIELKGNDKGFEKWFDKQVF